MPYVITRPNDNGPEGQKLSLYREGKLLVFATIGEAEDYCNQNGITFYDTGVEIEYIDGVGEAELMGE